MYDVCSSLELQFKPFIAGHWMVINLLAFPMAYLTTWNHCNNCKHLLDYIAYLFIFIALYFLWSLGKEIKKSNEILLFKTLLTVFSLIFAWSPMASSSYRFKPLARIGQWHLSGKMGKKEKKFTSPNSHDTLACQKL